MINKRNILMTFLGYPSFSFFFALFPPFLYSSNVIREERRYVLGVYWDFHFPIFVMLFGEFIFLSRSRTELHIIRNYFGLTPTTSLPHSIIHMMLIPTTKHKQWPSLLITCLKSRMMLSTFRNWSRA